MSECKLSVILKQQTPMIHFQSGEEGATIRGSDLKPRLDKFLGYDSKNKETSYKVKISTEFTQKVSFFNKSISSDENMKKMFFTANPKKQLFKYTIYKKIELEFFSFNKNVLEKIRKNIEFFFVLNNFGKRQTKGFGGFTVDSYSYSDKGNRIRSKGKNIIDLLKQVEEMGKCTVYYKCLSDYRIETFYKAITDFYKDLKMGKNSYIAKKYNNLQKIRVAYSPNIARVINNNIQSCRSSIEFRKLDKYAVILVYETSDELSNSKFVVNGERLDLNMDEDLEEIITKYNSDTGKGYTKI